MKTQQIQRYLREHKLDAWLMADFHGRNEIAVAMLGIKGPLTRRAFYFIPAQGDPVALINPVEASKFGHLPGKLITYRGYLGLEDELARLLTGCTRVAMEYSLKGRLPYVGLVDAGTIELVRSLDVEVISSADMVAGFQARLSAEQIASHRVAAHNLMGIMKTVFEYIAMSLKQSKRITEFDVCRFITQKFEECDMVTESGPICAVDAHAGDPHYEPARHESADIREGQLILIDMWARKKSGRSAYADITWMAFAGRRSEVPGRYATIFDVLVKARDAAVDFLREHVYRRPVFGCEVDDVCRGVVESAGFGPHFTHRTGHSITDSPHGPGPNIDNLESEDRRELQEGHLFSIEPGIYMDDCGFRSEIDCLIGRDGPEVTTQPMQTEITSLF